MTAGIGHGAHPDHYAQFQQDSRALAKSILEQGMAHAAATYGHGAIRLAHKRKDPRGFDEFIRQFSEHSAQGSANTMLGYQARRPSLYDLRESIAAIACPVLVVAGDEDDPTLEPSLMLKRTIAHAALAAMPGCGHMLNLEDPALFNRLLEEFFHQVECGRWPNAG